MRPWVRPAMVVTPLVAGAFFPAAHTLQWFIRYGLIFMIFMACLKIQFVQMVPRRTHWYVLGANLAISLLAFFGLKLLAPEQLDLALAGFFVGVMPTATTAAVVVSFLHGRVSYAVTGFIITNFFVACALVWLIPMTTGQYSWGLAGAVGKNLLLVTGLPMGLSVVVRRVIPSAKDWPSRYSFVCLAVWSFMLFILSSIARQHFIDRPEESPMTVVLIALITLGLCVLNFTVGRAIAPRKYKRETAQLLGQKNTTLSIFLALHFANPLVALAPTFYILFHNIWTASLMYLYDHHKSLRQERYRRCRAAR
ncbi:MAG: hypothetical protein IKX46_01515 [Verrucomicrobia bacterium]|nr:hypothetical protein [Verrucomicrobiota bacterium]